MSSAARSWLVALGLTVVAAGCGGPGGHEPLGHQASAVTFPNDQTAFDYFLGKGLTNYQAAGIVGNLDQESGVDPTAVESGGPGRGIAQWSVGGRWDTDANDNAEWYAGMQGQSVNSLQLQLDFIWYELTTFSSYGLAALQQTTNVTDATVAFENDFEGCTMCDQSTRIGYAQNVLSVYGNDTVDAGPTPDAGEPDDAGMTDAGMTTEPDAGMTEPPDAGMTTQPDASSKPKDAGGEAPGPDASSHDAAARDAAPAAGDAASPSTGGGCSSAPGPVTGSSAACLLACVGGLVVRRRNRASRRS